MEHVTEATSFVTSDDSIGSLALLSDPNKESLRTELLWRLRRLVIHLMDNHVSALVYIDSKLEDLGFRFSLFI